MTLRKMGVQNTCQDAGRSARAQRSAPSAFPAPSTRPRGAVPRAPGRPRESPAPGASWNGAVPDCLAAVRRGPRGTGARAWSRDEQDGHAVRRRRMGGGQGRRGGHDAGVAERTGGQSRALSVAPAGGHLPRWGRGGQTPGSHARAAVVARQLRPSVTRSYGIPGSSPPTASEKRSAF